MSEDVTFSGPVIARGKALISGPHLSTIPIDVSGVQLTGTVYFPVKVDQEVVLLGGGECVLAPRCEEQ